MIKKILLAFAMIVVFQVKAVFAFQTRDYLQQSQAAMEAGRVYVALDILQQAERQIKTPIERALISIALADALLRNGQRVEANAKLESVYQAISDTQQPAILSDVMQRFGHISVASHHTQAAYDWYKKSLKLAKQSNDHAQIATLLLDISKISHDASLLEHAQVHTAGKGAANKQKNQQSQVVDALDELEEVTSVTQLLEQANVHIQQLSDSATKQQLLVALGYQATQQGQVKMAQEALQTVLKSPLSRRLKSESLGQMGALYAQQQRTSEALQLTEQALLSDSSPDLQLQWNWQRAKLLVASQQMGDALLAYRSAAQQLQQLRIDIPVVYHNGKSSFNQTYAPLYTDFIELLLQQAEQENGTQQQQLLEEVVQSWEQLKAVELQDYFREACEVKQQKMTTLDTGTAMLYPMLLNDHLALVVRFSDQIKAYSVSQPPRNIEAIVRQLHKKIYNRGAVLTWSKRLYQWLIKPIAADLQQHKVETLVYLPDGVLRTIPFSVLHDGEQYLAEQYALVTVPGLSMLAKRSTKVNKSDILLAGMSEAGVVIEELMKSGLDIFDESAEARGLIPTLPLRGLAHVKLEKGNVSRAYTEKARQTLALPGVTTELQTLSSMSDAPVMENDTFLRENFKQHIYQGHSIVHIASHGFFSGDPEQSFVMTYDHLLNMQQLSELFQAEAFHERPIELVTLSACQTAEGDDRSPLGLSGVVVQMGVKSAVGSLWNVADQAAQQFFSDFYTFYQQPGMSKAKAMQKAQQALLKNDELAHPFYWAPFILVGEWH